MVVGRGVRLPCSDSDESEDNVLSIGPMQPVVTAAPLGGARGQDDGMIQANSLSDEWSVDSWTAEDRCGTCCAQLDNFDWVIPACDLVGGLPIPEKDDGLSDIEPDVCDVPDEFPVPMETAAVESLCFPVVVQTIPQGGAVTQSCPCLCARGRISWWWTVRMLSVPDGSPSLKSQMSLVRSAW